MKLVTLLAYQKSYGLMRELEGLRRLSGNEYLDALKAKSLFDYELAQHIQETRLETTK